MDVHIRWMIRRDMREVLQIEFEAFEFPWSEDDFNRVLVQRNAIGVVAEHKHEVIGFVIYSLHKTRLELLNFAVSPKVHRQGVGRRLAEHLVKKLHAGRRTRLTANVRESNLAAQLFLRAVGFRAVNVVRGLYEDTPEDAYAMVYRLRTEATV